MFRIGIISIAIFIVSISHAQNRKQIPRQESTAFGDYRVTDTHSREGAESRPDVRPDAGIGRQEEPVVKSNPGLPRNDNRTKIDEMQSRVSHLSKRCNDHARESCKDVSDLDLELKEIRGSDTRPAYVADQLHAFEMKLNRIEQKFLAE